MKIIAVNINKALPLNSLRATLIATERAWKLNINKCKNYTYVIGIAKGDICSYAYFKLNGVTIDLTEPPRVKFDLSQCSQTEITNIDNYLSNNGIDLLGVTTKYIF